MPSPGSRYGRHSPRGPKKIRLGNKDAHPGKVSDLFPRRKRLTTTSGNYSAVEQKGKLVVSRELRHKLDLESQNTEQIARDAVRRLSHDAERIDRSRTDSSDPFGEELSRHAYISLVDKRKKEAIRKVLFSHFKSKHSNKQLIRRLFKSPFRFTVQGKKAYVLSTGFENIFEARRGIPPRAFVCVFIGGKRLFFYRSSGKNTGRPGEWFPCADVEIDRDFQGRASSVGHITKLQGHPQAGMRSFFPTWVDRVTRAISEGVARGKIILEPRSAPEDFARFQEALLFYPAIDQRGSRSGNNILPDSLH